MRLVKAAEMQQMDKTAIEEIGIPGIVLMENAGRVPPGFFSNISLLPLMPGFCSSADEGTTAVTDMWLHGISARRA